MLPSGLRPSSALSVCALGVGSPGGSAPRLRPRAALRRCPGNPSRFCGLRAASAGPSPRAPAPALGGCPRGVPRSLRVCAARRLRGCCATLQPRSPLALRRSPPLPARYGPLVAPLAAAWRLAGLRPLRGRLRALRQAHPAPPAAVPCPLRGPPFGGALRAAGRAPAPPRGGCPPPCGRRPWVACVAPRGWGSAACGPRVPRLRARAACLRALSKLTLASAGQGLTRRGRCDIIARARAHLTIVSYCGDLVPPGGSRKPGLDKTA